MPAFRRSCTSVEQVAVDPDGLLAEREELARLDGDVPELRGRRGERLARVRVVERGRFGIRFGRSALRAQPSPHIELPRHAEEGGRAAERAVVAIVGGRGAELHADPRQEPAIRRRSPFAGRWRPCAAATRRSGLFAIASATSASSVASLNDFNQSFVNSPPPGSARHAGGMRVAFGNAWSTTSVCVGGALSAQPATHHRRDEKGGAHHPENGYSQLYHV